MTRAALTPTVTGCFLLTALIYPPSYTHGLFAFAVLPLGAGLLPVFVWPQLEQAWTVMCLEHRGIGRVLLFWCGACVLLVSAAAGAGGMLAGGGWPDELRRILLGAIIGYALVLATFQLLRRMGTSAAISAIAIATVLSATLGGDVLAGTPLWILAIPAWPETATSGPRLAIALIAGCIAVAALQRPTERLLER